MGGEVFRGQERRQYVRFEKALLVRFKVVGDNSEKVYTGITRDISQGGICIELDRDTKTLIQNLEPGETKLDISIDLPALPEPVELNSRVVWTRSIVDWIKDLDRGLDYPYFIGLSFEEVSLIVRDQIHSFILKEFIEGYGKKKPLP